MLIPQLQIFLEQKSMRIMPGLSEVAARNSPVENITIWLWPTVCHGKSQP